MTKTSRSLNSPGSDGAGPAQATYPAELMKPDTKAEWISYLFTASENACRDTNTRIGNVDRLN
jgi:hypothetical protein